MTMKTSQWIIFIFVLSLATDLAGATTHFSSTSCGRYRQIFHGIVLEASEAGGPSVGPGDEVAVLDSSGNVIGAAVVGGAGTYLPTQYSLVACGDDEFTGADEGAVTGEQLGFLFWDRERDLEFSLVPVDPYTGGALTMTWNGDMWFAPETEVYLRLQLQGAAPVIESFTVEPRSAAPGSQVEIRALFDDPDRDDLTYSFSATCGSLERQGGTAPYGSYSIHTAWYAPSYEAKCFLRLKVEDPSGKSDTQGVLIDVEAVDETPPEDPPELVITWLGEGAIRIAWDPSRSADLVNYRLYVRKGQADQELLATLEPSATSYEFRADGDEGEYVFTLTAVDENQNESRGVSASWSFTGDETPPEITVEVRGDQLWVTAIDDRAIGQDGLNITILDQEGQRLSPQPVPDISPVEGETGVVAVLVLKPGDYVVAVKAVDWSGNTAEKMVPRRVEEGAVFSVSGLEDGDVLYLLPDESDSFGIAGGRPPYTVSGNSAPYVVHARVRASRLVLRAREPGFSEVRVEDAAGAFVDFEVQVVEPVEEEGVKAVSVENLPTGPDPLQHPLYITLTEDELAVEILLPDYKTRVDVYSVVAFYPRGLMDGTIVFLGQDGKVSHEPRPLFSGISGQKLGERIISVPRGALPAGDYTFYTLVTCSGNNIADNLFGNLYTFSFGVDRLSPGETRVVQCGRGCEATSGEECPVCASLDGDRLKIEMDVPIFSTGPVDLYLALDGESGIRVIRADGTLEEFHGVEDLVVFGRALDGMRGEFTVHLPAGAGKLYWLITPRGEVDLNTYILGVQEIE